MLRDALVHQILGVPQIGVWEIWLVPMILTSVVEVAVWGFG